MASEANIQTCCICLLTNSYGTGRFDAFAGRRGFRKKMTATNISITAQVLENCLALGTYSAGSFLMFPSCMVARCPAVFGEILNAAPGFC